METIKIGVNNLKTLSSFVNDEKIVQAMNDAGCTFPAMALALQTLTEKIKEVEKVLLNEEDK